MKKTRLLRNNFQRLFDRAERLYEVLEEKYELIFSLKSEIKTLKQSLQDLRDLSKIKNKDLREMSKNSILMQGKVNFYKFSTYTLSGILLVHWMFDLLRGDG